jgi:hypothetical protein
MTKLSHRYRGPLVLAACLVLASCGREAPFFAPSPRTGDLVVTSAPAGAAILLDGEDTGRATPDTLRGLAGGEHVVRVELWGWTAEPDSLVVRVEGPDAGEASFDLAPAAPGPPRVVVLEAFSNVDCIGCPEMAATVEALMASAGYGPDRLLLVEYATGSPSISDPHYQAAIDDNDLRRLYYFPGTAAITIPALLADGAVLGALGQPPDLTALTAAVDGLLPADPGLAVTVAADVQTAAVTGTVTLAATRHVDLTGCTLQVALVEEPIVYGRPPGSQDQTVFHWVLRDLAAPVADLESPGPDAPRTHPFALARNASWVEDNLVVLAFIQRDATRHILQAGSTAAPPTITRPRSRTGGRS